MSFDDVIEDSITSTNIGWVEAVLELSGKYYDKYVISEKVGDDWKVLQTGEK
jgi:hypothetical protein